MAPFLAPFVLALGVAHAATVDRVAAVVNEEVISLSEIYEAGGPEMLAHCDATPDRDGCLKALEAQILDALVLDALMRQELKTLGIEITSAMVEAQIDAVANDNFDGDRAALRAAVEQSGLTWLGYRDTITTQLQQQAFSENVIRPRLQISDEDVKDLYREVTRDAGGPAKIADVSLIALAYDASGGADAKAAAVAAARALAASIRSGATTWDAARDANHAGTIGGKRGVMQGLDVTTVAPALGEAIAATDVGAISEPVLVGDYALLLRVDAKRSAEPPSFDALRPQLEEQVYQSKIEEEVGEWYQQARRRAAVKILL